ncbi:MAG: hypothetical protein ABL904_19710 [Hyphomicrobiaceae bacterium]
MTLSRHELDASGEFVAAVELWLLDRDMTADRLAAIEAATCRLSEDEINRVAAMSDRQQARLWAAGRTALRLLVEGRCGPSIRQQPFQYTPTGRPTIASSDIDFSVTDSGPYLLIAIACKGRIGIDIEQPREIKMPQERIDLIVAAGEGLAGFAAAPLQSWTRIEAFAKATAPSLASALAMLGVQGHGEGRLEVRQVHERARQARIDAAVDVHDIPLPQALFGAVACHSSPPPSVRILDIATIDRLTG